MDPLASYVAVWSEVDPRRRAALLESCWTEESEIIGPNYHFTGFREVLDEAARFMAEGSGRRAVQTSGFDRHGNWVRFTIAMVDAEGSVEHEGWDILELRPDGKIKRVITFWGRLDATWPATRSAPRA